MKEIYSPKSFLLTIILIVIAIFGLAYFLATITPDRSNIFQDIGEQVRDIEQDFKDGYYGDDDSVAVDSIKINEE